MKLPRRVSGDRLARALEHVGYSVIRQKGSHLRLRHSGPPPHTITVPLNNPMKVGTLHSILTEVAHMRSITIESLVELLNLLAGTGVGALYQDRKDVLGFFAFDGMIEGVALQRLSAGFADQA